MNGSQAGSQDSPGGNKVCSLTFLQLQILTRREDVRKRDLETSYDQANPRGVSYPSSKNLPLC
jgi:hypothetical protein